MSRYQAAKALANWRGVGLDAATAEQLQALAPHYLPDRYRHDLPDTPEQA